MATGLWWVPGTYRLNADPSTATCTTATNYLLVGGGAFQAGQELARNLQNQDYEQAMKREIDLSEYERQYLRWREKRIADRQPKSSLPSEKPGPFRELASHQFHELLDKFKELKATTVPRD